MAEEVMRRLVEVLEDHPPYWAIYYRQLVKIVGEIEKAPYPFIEEIKKLSPHVFERVYQGLADFPNLPEEVNEELKKEYTIRNASKRN